MSTIITGTGSYIPSVTKYNKEFAINSFYTENYEALKQDNLEIIEKFEKITGIAERRYAPINVTASDMAANAALLAIQDAGVDPETIDQLIVAHNFGDVIKHTIQTDAVPSLASRVKHTLGIKNPACIPYDILFGCPGWVQALIQAHAFMQAGVAKKCLVIGTETLSRVIDTHDRDSMIFSDGAGACVLELKNDEGTKQQGIIGVSARSYAIDELNYIYLGKSYFPESDSRIRYIKMQGRKVYEFALKFVPDAIKACLETSNVAIADVKKIFIHQANEKMDEAIITALYKLYGIDKAPLDVMPMNIKELGNSSVATIPTLFDMVLKSNVAGHSVASGDIIVFASVGAGMNINAICYKMP